MNPRFNYKFICEGRTCNDEERSLISLPVRFDGLGITNICNIANEEFTFSEEVTQRNKI